MATETARHVTLGKGGARYTGFPKVTLAEYQRVLAERWGEDPLKWRVVCPSCGTVQSLQDLFDAAKPETPAAKDALAKMIGVGCIGRGNYASYGLFCINKLIIVFEDGHEAPAFEPAPVDGKA